MTEASASESFDERFEHLVGLAYRAAYRLLGDRSDAEDVAQEALARTFSRWKRIRGHAEPWVVRVATNLALDRLRARTRARDHRVVGQGSPIDVGVDRLELVRLLESLPRRQREVLVLRYLGDRSEAETARVLGTSVGTVKRHAHRGLAALRTRWADLESESLSFNGGA